MRVVDLADEFGLTTADTLELCELAGVRATGGGDELTDADEVVVRDLHERRSAPPPPGSVGPDAPPPFGQTSNEPPYPSYLAATIARSTPTQPAGRGSGAGSHLAVFGITASLFGLCIPIVPAAIGIAFGTIAKRRARTAGNLTRVSVPATAAQVLGILFLVGWLVFFGWTYKAQHITVTLADQTEVQVRRTAFPDVQESDCLVLQPEALVEDLWVIDCSEAHDAQIVSFGDISPYDHGGESLAHDLCVGQAQLLGPTDHDLEVSFLVPTLGARKPTFHHGFCIVERRDGQPLVGRL